MPNWGFASIPSVGASLLQLTRMKLRCRGQEDTRGKGPEGVQLAPDISEARPFPLGLTWDFCQQQLKAPRTAGQWISYPFVQSPNYPPTPYSQGPRTTSYAISCPLPGSTGVKNMPANAGDAGLIPGSGRSPGEVATHSSIFAWEVPWTEEPMGYNPGGHNKSDMTK